MNRRSVVIVPLLISIMPPGQSGAADDAKTPPPELALQVAIEAMHEASVAIDARRDVGEVTRRLQQQALDALQALYDRATETPASSQSGSSVSPAPSQEGESEPSDEPPGGATPNTTGEGGQMTEVPVPQLSGPIEELRVEWGTLPPRVRDALQQAMSLPISEAYRDITEAYYRRIVEESSR
jgi:hypothetical protein